MSIKKAVYKCEICANVIEELWDGATEPQCCDKVMTKLEPNTTDAATEKHVPVIERDGNRVTVKVGEAPHPMTKEHYILFLEVVAGDKVYRHDFREGDEKAEAVFLIEEQDLTARAFCNLHGFWASK